MNRIISATNSGMFISLLSNVLGQFLMYLGVILLARSFSADEFGEFRYFFNVCAIINLIVLMGRDAFMIKERQNDEKIDSGYAIEFYAGFINIIVTFFIVVLLLFLLEHNGLVGDIEKYLLCILMVILWSFANLLIAILKVESKILLSQFLSNFVQRFCRFIFFVLVFFFFNDKIISAYYAMVFSQIAFVIALMWFLDISTIKLIAKTNLKKINYFKNFKSSFNLFMTTIVIVLALKIDIILLGLLAEWDEVAIYEIVLMVSMIVLLPQMASHKVTEINYLNSPYNNKLRTSVVNKAVIYSIIPTLIIIMFSKEILSIFGPDYVNGNGILILLSLGYFSSTFLGSPFETMMMNGYAKLSSRILIIQLIITIITIIFMFKILNLLGVAISMIFSIFIGKLIARRYCKSLNLFINDVNYKLFINSAICLCFFWIISLMT